MTHYCMLHNQPKMMLTNYKGDSLSMELAKGADIDLTEEHMHSLTIKFLGKDKISQRWSYFKEGKENHAADMIFTRVK